MRDIDRIIQRLKVELPGSQVKRLPVSNPGDDDGLWFVSISNRQETVQMESSTEDCPFLIESDFNADRHIGSSVEEVVSIVRRLFFGSQRS